jgi:hypothetical protein
LFRKKARQLVEEALIEIERHQSIQESRKFYKRLNNVRRQFEPQVAMCRAKNGELLTNKNQELARLKEHFEEHLNKGSESEQPTRPVDLKDDGVDIDLPSREEIALKYLKNNKADQKTRRPTTKALFRAKPNGRRNQGRPKSRRAVEVNSDSLALGHTVLKIGRH